MLCHPPDGSTSPKYKLLCFKHHNLFYQIQNALAFNRDICCHLALCLQLLPFHYIVIHNPKHSLVCRHPFMKFLTILLCQGGCILIKIVMFQVRVEKLRCYHCTRLYRHEASPSHGNCARLVWSIKNLQFWNKLFDDNSL